MILRKSSARGPAVRCLAPGLLAALVLTACTPTDGTGADGRRSPPQAADGAPVQTPNQDQERRPHPGTAWVIFGSDTVVAEVARTPDERATGLMYREEIPDGTGMLFVFQDSQVRSFWMQNTYVPLDIAFMDPSFRVVDIQQMEPLTTAPHESAAPAMFALEVRQGWFAEKGITVGSVARVIFGL